MAKFTMRFPGQIPYTETNRYLRNAAVSRCFESGSHMSHKVSFCPAFGPHRSFHAQTPSN
jgi:hypothetical protein